MPIELRNVDYVYDSGEPFEFFALRGISLRIGDGEFVGIVGRTGSGKSTLVEHLNGLLFASRGDIIVDGEVISNNRSILARIRRKVGIVFQYPEDQFFAETVFEEVAFGCRNFGFTEDQIDESVHKAMAIVGLDAVRFLPLSPFQLSGGEQRRVAIASVIAMGQKYLVLDEPTAGLDSRSKLAVLAELELLRQNASVTVILVSHNMDEVAEFCSHVIVLDGGVVAFDGSTEAFFHNASLVGRTGLELPESYRLAQSLRQCGSSLKVNEGSTDRMLDSLRLAVANMGEE
ncbi:MAG: ATP-binding cassette domain-containing protein [Candidatus Cryosericum sp.]|nr:ATP-binding cassette domain-containing protein [bacterium]